MGTSQCAPSLTAIWPSWIISLVRARKVILNTAEDKKDVLSKEGKKVNAFVRFSTDSRKQGGTQ